MQKVIIAIVGILILIGVGIGFFVFNSQKEPEQPRQTQEPDDDILPSVVIDRSFYEGLFERHPQGELFVQGILKALDELEDEDEVNDLNAFLVMGANLSLLEEKEEAFAWYQKALELDSINVLAFHK